MLTMDALRAFGADVESGLERCMNNEAFYIRLINMALADANFDKLAAAAESGDVHAAFKAAHSLKGMLGNLSLTPLYDAAFEITELLRSGAPADISAPLAQLKAQREKLREICE